MNSPYHPAGYVPQSSEAIKAEIAALDATIAKANHNLIRTAYPNAIIIRCGCGYQGEIHERDCPRCGAADDYDFISGG